MHTYNQVVNNPSLQSGAFLIVIPGPADVKPSRRKLEKNEPWITASPAIFADALPLKAFEALALALESRSRRLRNSENFQKVLGSSSSNSSSAHMKGDNDNKIFHTTNKMYNRGMHRFQIEVAPNPHSFPLCPGRGGACALWEGSTGRILLDAEVAQRMISNPLISKLLDRFTMAFASIINNNNDDDDGGGDDDGVSIGEEESKFNKHIYNNTGDASKDYTSTAFAAFIGAWISKAATAAISAVLLSIKSGSGVGRQPLWWCLTCPIVLGLLAPFVINFGLAAAAEQLCAALQLPAEECSDLWWGAFALAMVLSLGSAVPIVYVCRLPDCVKRALGDTNET